MDGIQSNGSWVNFSDKLDSITLLSRGSSGSFSFFMLVVIELAIGEMKSEKSQ
jgi:hypothetical protein